MPATKKRSPSRLRLPLKKVITTAVAATGPVYYFQQLRLLFNPVNESKLLIGCIMIVMNVATKYVDFGFTKTQENAMRSGVAREMIIFAACFMGTRDIILSLILTAVFAILANVLLHDSSQYCVVPKYMQKVTTLMDISKDGIVSPEEERRAVEILEKADRMREYGNHSNFMNYMHANL